MRFRWPAAVALCACTLLSVDCGGPGSTAASARKPATSMPTTPTPLPSAAPSPSRSADADPSLPPPAFHGSIEEIDGATRDRMATSWHPGCPVPIEDLRVLSLDHWGFDGRVHRGEMVVHRDVARDVVAVFRQLFDDNFPVRRMRLVDDYGGDDDRSMAADNTSGFNCRPVTGGSSWSEHAYGRAIDVNPLENPYVSATGTVEPPAGAPFADRSRRATGMIHAGDAVVQAFASVGWGWGGRWASPKDYQHFSATGR
jgi:hypothetical protein